MQPALVEYTYEKLRMLRLTREAQCRPFFLMSPRERTQELKIEVAF